MLATKLVEIGHDVTVIDKMKYSENSLDHLQFHKNFNLIIGDATNENY